MHLFSRTKIYAVILIIIYFSGLTESESSVSPSDLIESCPELSPYWERGPKWANLFDAAFRIRRLINVNEVGQTLAVSGYFKLRWNVNETCSFRNSSIPDDEMHISFSDYDEIWRPRVMFGSGLADQGMFEFLHTFKVKVEKADPKKKFRLLEFSWNRRGVFEGSCGLDLTSFPFDQQSCPLKFCTIGRTDRFIQSEYLITLDESQDSRQWFINDTDYRQEFVDAPHDDTYNESCVYYYVKMKRRPDFFVLNLMVPCLLLVALIIMTIMMPPGDIERPEMNIGIVMSIAVFHTVVVQYLPHTPQQVFLSTFILMLAGFSGLCTVQSIFVYWLSVTAKKFSYRKVWPGISTVRLVDIGFFITSSSLLIWTVIYAVRTATAN